MFIIERDQIILFPLLLYFVYGFNVPFFSK